MKRTTLFVAMLTATLTAAGQAVYANPVVPTQEKALPPITLDLRDAPIRSSLEQLFAAAKVDFQIDNSVVGFVTLKITDQPFENALKLILRASPVPLTYARESGVFIVKPRPLALTDPSLAAAPPPPLDAQQKPNYQPLEQIQLTYIDPLDLTNILGIEIIRSNVRQNMMGRGGMGGMGGGMMGGMGGGGMMGGMGGMGGMMGGMGGGMMGGMGGMGGMMGGGMGGMGGGMMGGMGGMGGGMGGMGMGGFGGGRSF